MQFTYSTILAILASTAVAIPLNINLGAYSPAVVVGDGEISFAAGAAGAESLVSTLQGQAANGQGAVAEGAAIAPAQRSAILSEPASLPVPGARAELNPHQKRQEGGLAKRQSGFDRALTYAEAALVKGPKIQLGTPAAGVGIIVDNNPTPAGTVTKAE